MRGQTFKFKSQKQKLAPTRVGPIYCSPGNLDKTQLKTTRPMASLENREMKSNREYTVVFVRNTMAEARNTKPVCRGGERYGKEGNGENVKGRGRGRENK